MSQSNTPNLFTALRPDIENGQPLFDDGDCAIILKLDGSFKIVTTGVDEEQLKKDPELWSDRERSQVQLGEKLMALGMALSNDQIMDVLLNIIRDPDIVDPERLAHVTNRH